MLLALSLAFAPLPAAAPPVAFTLALPQMAQSAAPDFRWSREVDERFWQALHLLEVEDRPEDAAAEFAELLDEPSVLQFRGHAGFLLAHRYRALKTAGRHEEAAALLPSIRRDIAGTPLADEADAVIDLADRVASTQDELDDGLLRMIRERAEVGGHDLDTLRPYVQSYGERLVPYILRILDRPEELTTRGGGEPFHAARLWRAGWSLDSEAFLSTMQSRFRSRGASYFGAVVESLEGPFTPAKRRFVLEMLQSDHSSIVRRMSSVLVGALEVPEFFAEFQRRIEEGDEKWVDPLLDRLLSGWADPADERVRAAQVALANRTGEERERTRALIFARGDIPGLLALAEDGDGEAERLLLLYLARLGDGNSKWQFNSLRYVLEPRSSWIDEWQDSHPNGGLVMARPEVGPESPWTEWLRAKLGARDEDTLCLGARAAALGESWDLAREFIARLEGIGMPDDLPTLLGPPSPDFARELGPQLAPLLLEAEEIGFLAVFLPGRCPLTVEQLAAITAVADSEQLAGDAVRKEVERRAKLADPEARARALQEIVSARVLPSGPRATAAARRMDPPGSDWPDAADLDEVLVCVESDDLGFRPIDRHGIVVQLFAISSNMLQAGKGDAPRLEELMERAARLVGRLNVRDARRGDGINDFLRGNFRVLRPGDDAGLADRIVAELLASTDNPLEYLDELRDVLSRLPKTLALVTDRMAEADARQRDRFYQAVDPSQLGNGSGECLRLVLEAPAPQAVWRVWAAVAREPNEFRDFDWLLDIAREHAHVPEVASQAVTAMARLGAEHDEVLAAIRGAWELEHLEWRDVLVDLAGQVYDPSLVDLLLEAQVSAVPKVSAAADEALKRYALIRDSRASWQAWERQGREGSPAEALIDKLDAEHATSVRVAAIQSLGTLRAQEALPFLVELLEDENAQVTAAAAEALRQINAGRTTDEEE